MWYACLLIFLYSPISSVFPYIYPSSLHFSNFCCFSVFPPENTWLVIISYFLGCFFFREAAHFLKLCILFNWCMSCNCAHWKLNSFLGNHIFCHLLFCWTRCKNLFAGEKCIVLGVSEAIFSKYLVLGTEMTPNILLRGGVVVGPAKVGGQGCMGRAVYLWLVGGWGGGVVWWPPSNWGVRGDGGFRQPLPHHGFPNIQGNQFFSGQILLACSAKRKRVILGGANHVGRPNKFFFTKKLAL